MATLGARLLEEQSSAAETATAVGMRHAGEQASLRTVASAVELALTQVVRWMAWWAGTEARPEDVKATVELNKEFFSVKLSPDELRALIQSWQADGMSWETLYFNLTRGGIAREAVTAEEEKAAIKREGPAPVVAPPKPPGAPPVPQADGDPGDDEIPEAA